MQAGLGSESRHKKHKTWTCLRAVRLARAAKELPWTVPQPVRSRSCKATSADMACSIQTKPSMHSHCAEKRKEKTTPFGVNLMRSQVLYRAAQIIVLSTFHTHIAPSTLPLLGQCRCEHADSETWEGVETGLADSKT